MELLSRQPILLVEFLGTDLGKIDKELEKLCLVVPKGVEINPEAIEVQYWYK